VYGNVDRAEAEYLSFERMAHLGHSKVRNGESKFLTLHHGKKVVYHSIENVTVKCRAFSGMAFGMSGGIIIGNEVKARYWNRE
jgi:hypothetical protein